MQKQRKPHLLSKLGIVPTEEQGKPYSVLIEPLNEFTIY